MLLSWDLPKIDFLLIVVCAPTRMTRMLMITVPEIVPDLMKLVGIEESITPPRLRVSGNFRMTGGAKQKKLITLETRRSLAPPTRSMYHAPFTNRHGRPHPISKGIWTTRHCRLGHNRLSVS